MNILVQDVVSKCVWNGQDWAKDIGKAASFRGVNEAITFCIENRLREALLVFRFKDLEEDISLRVRLETREDVPEEARLQLLAAVRKGLRKHCERLEIEVGKTVSELDSVNRRLNFARKALDKLRGGQKKRR